MRGYSPVAPVHILRQLKDAGVLGEYHLLLAHDVVDKPMAYREIFDPIEDFTIILDNSLIELGHPAPIEVMVEAFDMLRPSITVLPDVLGDWLQTVDMSIKASEEYAQRGIAPLMAVPQGRNHRQIMRSAELMSQLPNVTAWGVPRFIADEIGTRRQVVKELTEKYPHMSIHLLGFSDYLMDDIDCCRMPNVTGIDSTEAIRVGMMRQNMDLFDRVNPGPRRDFWEKEVTITDEVIQNIQLVRQWINLNR